MVVDDEGDDDEHEPEEVPDQDGVPRDLAQVPSELDEQPIGVMQEHLYGFNFNMLADNHAEGARFHTMLYEDRLRPLVWHCTVESGAELDI